MQGQASMELTESLLISGVGILVVLFELFLLALFVMFLAKVVSLIIGKKTDSEKDQITIGTSLNQVSSGLPNDSYASLANKSGNAIEMSAALSACFAECGYTPKEDEVIVINAKNGIFGGK